MANHRMATGGPVGKLCYLDGLPAKPKIEIDELPAKRARRLGDQSDDAAVIGTWTIDSIYARKALIGRTHLLGS
jgi:hypothetical protein